MSTPGPQHDLDALAGAPIDDDDLAVLVRLAGLYDTLDPVPAGLIERVQFGITLDALHAEIAELQRVDQLAGARSDDVSAAQTVTFTSASLTTMITITPTSAESARIDGWAAPGAGLQVELRTTDGVQSTVADSDGRFVFDEVARGLGQFVLRRPDSHPAEHRAGGPDEQPPVITPSIDI